MSLLWNDSIKLPNGYTETTDPDGFSTKTPIYTVGIPANFLSTTRADKTLANQSGYTADIKIEIVSCNYNDQETLIDEKNSREYDIKETYQEKNKETIQLTCQRR